MSKKNDKDKPRVDLINPKFIEEMGKGLGYGADKYSDMNYRENGGLELNRLYASSLRHLLAFANGKLKDEESQINNLVAVSINCMMIYTLQKDLGKEFNYWNNNEKQKYTKRSKKLSSRKVKKKN